MSNLLLAYYALLPELYLLGWTLILLLLGVYAAPRANAYQVVASVGIMAMTGYLAVSNFHQPIVAFSGMFIADRFALLAKCLILAGSSLTLMLSVNWLREQGGRPFEFVILVMLATVGMMLLVSSGSLLALYMALEMMSLALYVLASFERDHAKSSEAGLKYVVLGALASGMMLYGMSLVYGFAGTIGFSELAALFSGGAASKGVIVGMVLIMIGFCFKIAAVPFHMWSPDVYEGAPTPVTAFFATAPKVAAMALFVRVLMQPFGPLVQQWQQVVIFVSVASMLVGALAAIRQTNIKRLLAYSSIGHAGFMLMGLAAGNVAGVQAILIYLALYIFMSAGAFGCVLMMRRAGKSVEQISDLAGLAQTHPLHALLFAAFMFSMAGIPPLAGFFGKMYVVLAAVSAGLTWLAVIGVAASVVGGFYYIKVVKIMYFDAPAAPFDAQTSRLFRFAMALSAGVTLLYFIHPTPLIEQAKLAAEALLP